MSTRPGSEGANVSSTPPYTVRKSKSGLSYLHTCRFLQQKADFTVNNWCWISTRNPFRWKTTHCFWMCNRRVANSLRSQPLENNPRGKPWECAHMGCYWIRCWGKLTQLSLRFARHSTQQSSLTLERFLGIHVEFVLKRTVRSQFFGSKIYTDTLSQVYMFKIWMKLKRNL